MTSDPSLEIRILTHCLGDYRSITQLIPEASSKSTLYRVLKTLLEGKDLEADGKERYRTTDAGRLHLQRLLGKSPDGLASYYPPLAKVPTPLHVALIELILVSVIARMFDLRPDRHPTFIIAGPTLTWKTSLARFVCHMLGLDPVKHIINLAGESGRSLWLRKSSTGEITYERELLNSPIIILDEYSEATPDTKRLITMLTSGSKKVMVENQERTIQPVPVITLNPKQGRTLEDRLYTDEPQLRRSIPCDLSRYKIPNLATTGESIVESARTVGPISLPKPRYDLASHRRVIDELFRATLNEEGRKLVDFETLVMLCWAMTSYKEPMDAIRLVFFDSLLLFETIGWTQTGWALHVTNFPTTVSGNAAIDSSPDNETISDEDWIRALMHLEAGGTTVELVTKLGFTVDKSERIAKKCGELKIFDAKALTRSSEEKGECELKLERELRIAELERQKAELLRPLELDRELADLRATLEQPGRWRQGHCRNMTDNYCAYWRWEQRPDLPYQVGEPQLKDGKWCIRPTTIRCAVCSAYHEKGQIDIQTLDASVKDIQKTLAATPNTILKARFICPKCGSRDSVAVGIQCTKCEKEFWASLHG